MFIIYNALICYSCFVHSCFTEAYRKECLATTVKLLEKLCKGVKQASFTQNYPNIPVACMNLVASVSDFVHSDNRQRVREVNLRKQDASISDRQVLLISNTVLISFRRLKKGNQSSNMQKT